MSDQNAQFSPLTVNCHVTSSGRTTNAWFAERGREDPCVAPQGVVAWTRVRRRDESGRALSLSGHTPTLSCDKRTGEDTRNHARNSPHPGGAMREPDRDEGIVRVSLFCLT